MLLGLFIKVKNKWQFYGTSSLTFKLYPRPVVNAVAMPEPNGETDQLN